MCWVWYLCPFEVYFRVTGCRSGILSSPLGWGPNLSLCIPVEWPRNGSNKLWLVSVMSKQHLCQVPVSSQCGPRP